MGLNSFRYCFWMFLDGLILQNKKSHSKSESFPQTTVRICNRRKKLWQLPSRLMFHFGLQELLGNPACHSNGRPAKKGNFAGSKVSRPQKLNLNHSHETLGCLRQLTGSSSDQVYKCQTYLNSSVLWGTLLRLMLLNPAARNCGRNRFNLPRSSCQGFSLHMGFLRKKYASHAITATHVFFPSIFTTHSLGAPDAVGGDSQGQWFMQASALNKSLRRIIRFRL